MREELHEEPPEDQQTRGRGPSPGLPTWTSYPGPEPGVGSPAPMGAAGPGQIWAVPWRPRDVWLGVVFAAITVAIALGLAVLLAATSANPNIDLWVGLFPSLFELLFIAVAWWFSVRKYHAPWRTLGFVKFRPSMLAVGFGLLWVTYFVIGIYNYFLRSFGLEMQTDVTPVVQELASPWPLVFTAVVIAPVSEEIFFRGFVFGGLRPRYGWLRAAVISSALFAMAHGQLTFFPAAFLLGFLFAYLYQRSGSVWPGLILHMVVNGLALGVAVALSS